MRAELSALASAAVPRTPHPGTIRRDPLEGGAWEVVDVREIGAARDHAHSRLPSCPSGNFCLASAPVKSDSAAPAPFDTCAATTTLPSDASRDPRSKPPQRSISFAADLTRSERASDPSRAGACCYTWVIPCPGGRTLRDGNEAIVSDAVASAAWLDALPAPTERNGSSIPLPFPDGVVSAAWAAEAAFEHASIASFNLAIVDWMQLGAPAELVEAGQRAALDEIAHARALYALASRYAGAPVGPGPLPAQSPRGEPTFDRVTRETFLDACLNECLAAAIAEARAELAVDAAVRSALRAIARDEATHAELAWRVVGWLLDAGGAEAREALAAAVDSLDAMPSPPACPDAPEQGFLSEAAQLALRQRVIDEVVRPVAARLLGQDHGPMGSDVVA